MEDRGKQSWGWTDGENVVKQVGAFQNGFNHTMLGTPSALIHTRLATFGEKTAENSHPFSIKGMIGVHNGMIDNHKEIAAKYGIEYKVDSEVIFHAIADKIPMSELRGYGTIVFYRDGKIHLGRFSNRGDLHLAMTDAGWIWASEKNAVLNAAGIGGIEIKYWADTKLGELYQLDGENFLLTDQDMTVGERAALPGKTDWRDFGNYQPGSYTGVSNAYNGGGWYGYNRKNLPLPNAQTTTFTAEPTSDADEVIDVGDEYVDGGNGHLQSMGSYVDDVVDDDYFNSENFYRTMADEHFGDDLLGQCDDCLTIVDGDQTVFVHKWTEEAFCVPCHLRNNVSADDQVSDEDAKAFVEAQRDWERDLAAQDDLHNRGAYFQTQLNSSPINSGSYFPF